MAESRRRIGSTWRRFEPVDAGPLRFARHMEPFALLMGRLAYEGDRGPEVAYRFEQYA